MSSARDHVADRPASGTALLAGAAVIVAGKLGVTFTADEAAILVGAAAYAASLIAPPHPRRPARR